MSKKNVTKIISVLVVMVLVMSLFSVTALADGKDKFDGKNDNGKFDGKNGKNDKDGKDRKDKKPGRSFAKEKGKKDCKEVVLVPVAGF